MNGSVAFLVVCVCLFGLAVAMAQRWWIGAIVLGVILWTIGETCYWRHTAEWWWDDDAHDAP